MAKTYMQHLRTARATYLIMPFEYYDSFMGTWVAPKASEVFEAGHRYTLSLEAPKVTGLQVNPQKFLDEARKTTEADINRLSEHVGLGGKPSG